MEDRNRKSMTIGQEMVRDLTDLVETIECGQPVAKKFTVRTVKLNLEPEAYGPSEVKAIRERLGVSQALLARILATSVQTIENWEQGTRNPTPMACRLMGMIKRKPQEWIDLLEASRTDAAVG